MDLDLTDEERAVRDLCRDFARGEIAPNAQRWWDEGETPVEVFRQMGALGLMGLLVPPEYGGGGASTVGFVAALEELARADQSVAATWQAHSTIGTLPLLAFGTEEQRQRWLVPLAAGQALGGFGLTEPDAGSDASAVRTLARRDGNGWVINGAKMFISNAGTDMSGGVTILARVASNTSDDGFANFFVPRGTPGYDIGRRLHGIGWRSVDTRELSFRDCRVPVDHLIGEGDRGLTQCLAVLDVGRVAIAALSVGLADAVLQLSLEHARQRVQFGRPIGTFQAIQMKLAEMASEMEAVRWLVYRAAWLRDRGERFRKEAAMAKLRASALAVRAASEAVQIHGGYGLMLEHPVARYYLDAKVLEIGEGTNEIQRLVIARELEG